MQYLSLKKIKKRQFVQTRAHIKYMNCIYWKNAVRKKKKAFPKKRLKVGGYIIVGGIRI